MSRFLAVALLCAAGVALPGVARAQVAAFGPPQTVAAGGSPQRAAAGDLNGDGRSDLVAILDNRLAIFLGDAAGLRAGATYAGPVSSDIEIGDLNGDGRVDVVTGSGDVLLVYLGQGDGTLQPAQSVAANVPPTRSRVNDIALGDFNADGFLDVVGAQTGPLPDDNVSIYWGNGDGTLDPPVKTVYGDAGPIAIAAGDFNADGLDDYAVGLGSVRRVEFQINNNDGTFTGFGAIPDFGNGRMTTADLDGSGTDDVLVVNAVFSTVSIFFMGADGRPQPRQDYPVRDAGGCNDDSCGRPTSVTVGDFNGDGHPDFATANRTTRDASVFINDGEGQFTRVLFLTSDPFPHDAVAADFTGDGRTDVALTNGDTTAPDGSVAAGARIVTVFSNTTESEGGGPGLVVWTNVINAAAAEGSLLKTGGCDGCFDGRGVAEPIITGGDITATFRPADDSKVLIAGLTTVASPTMFSEIAFGIRIQNGWAEVRESGAYRADTRFVAGDVFTIAVISNVVSYLKNDAPFYTSTAAPTFPMRFAALLASAGAGILDATLTLAADPPPPPPPPPPPSGGITWGDTANVSVTDDAIQKTSGCDGCYDAFGVSTETVGDGGFFEFTANHPSALLIAGLTGSYPGSLPGAIDFGIRLQNGWAEVRERGVYVADVRFEVGDVLRISVNDGVVTYAINGLVFYTSTETPAAVLAAIVAFANIDGSIGRPTLHGGS